MDVGAALIDIAEFRRSASLRDSLSRRDKSVRNSKDGIASLNSSGNQCEPQGACATRHADTNLHFAKLRKLPFEFFHPRSTDESGCVSRASAHRHQSPL